MSQVVYTFSKISTKRVMVMLKSRFWAWISKNNIASIFETTEGTWHLRQVNSPVILELCETTNIEKLIQEIDED